MEEADYLSKICAKVYLIVRRDAFRASKAMQARVSSNPKIDILWNSRIDEILGQQAVEGIRIKSNIDDSAREIALEGVFVAIGHHPSTELFAGQLDLSPEGYILTQAGTSLTNLPGVFAAGDVQDNRYRQAITSAGSGCKAALDAEKYLADCREINCAAYRAGDEIVVSACEEPKTDNKFLTFGDKYMGEGKQRAGDFPAKISKESAERIRGYTKLLYRRMNLRGVVRADFLMAGGEVYFNEMNTVPGSLAWYLFCDKLADFRGVLTALIEQGIREFRAQEGKKLLRNCGVLNGFRPSSGKMRRG